MSTASRFSRTSLRMLSGLLIWACHFGMIYSFTALACARGFWRLNWLGVGIVPWAIGAATLVAVSAASGITILSIRYAGERTAQENASRFVHWMTAAIGALALLAIVWQALPVLLVPTCG